MTLENLKETLCRYGTLEMCKAGHVLTVLITGKKLSNWKTVNEIQKHIIEYAGDVYPTIEVLKNDESFFCMVLRP